MCVVNERVIDGKTYVPHDEYKRVFDKACKLSVEGQELEKTIKELTREKAEMAKQLAFSIKLPDCRPITVARTLIDMKETFFEDRTLSRGFDKWELRQIAEHLLVYCNGAKKMISPEDSYLFTEQLVEHHLKDMEKKELFSKEYLEEYKN